MDREPMRQIIITADEDGIGYTVECPSLPGCHSQGDTWEEAIANIKAELDEQVMALRHEGKLLEAQRLLARTKYDLEMMEEVGYCSGIENYSMHLDGRKPGERPYAMLDYFHHVPGMGRDDWLLFIDESHATLPQVRAMYNGDRMSLPPREGNMIMFLSWLPHFVQPNESGQERISVAFNLMVRGNMGYDKSSATF